MKMFRGMLVGLVLLTGFSIAEAQDKKVEEPTWKVQVIESMNGQWPNGPLVAPKVIPIKKALILVADSEGGEFEAKETNDHGFANLTKQTDGFWLIVTARGFAPLLVHLMPVESEMILLNMTKLSK